MPIDTTPDTTPAEQFGRELDRLTAANPALGETIDDQGNTGLSRVAEFRAATDPGNHRWDDLHEYLAKIPPDELAGQIVAEALRSVDAHREVMAAVAEGKTLRPAEGTDANFTDVVLSSNTPVLVDYWGPSCAPCLLMAPLIEVLAKEFEGTTRFVKVNVEENPECARHAVETIGSQGIPTFALYSGGKVVGHIIGACSSADLRSLIGKATGPVAAGGTPA